MSEVKILYEGKYMRLVSQSTWEYAERINCAGVVFIIAVTEDEKIVLCEQHRVPVNNDVIEIPAGLVRDTAASQEESFEDAAKRELLEETGYEAQEVVLLFDGPAAVGSSSAIVHFLLGEEN
jgi:ADP-ribose pyrophosphatase